MATDFGPWRRGKINPAVGRATREVRGTGRDVHCNHLVTRLEDAAATGVTRCLQGVQGNSLIRHSTEIEGHKRRRGLT